MVNAVEKEFQEKYYEYEYLKQELENTDAQLREMSNSFTSMQAVINTLKAIEKTKDGEKILIPIGEGVVIKASFDKDDRALVNIGNNIVLNKDFDEAVNFINKRLDEVNEFIKRLNGNAEFLIQKLRSLESELMELQKKRK